MPKASHLPNSTAFIRLEQDGDAVAIQKMYCRAFGPGRFARTAYRIREGGAYGASISCVMEAPCLKAHLDITQSGGQIAGSIRYSEIEIGKVDKALLLGPLVVSEDCRGHNYGIELMQYSLALAKQAGFRLVILVGDLAYYQKVGFVRVETGAIRLPAPYNPYRLLAYEIETGALKDYNGLIRPHFSKGD